MFNATNGSDPTNQVLPLMVVEGATSTTNDGIHPGTGEPMRHPIELTTATAVLIAVPLDFQAIKKKSPELAQRWRLESRAALEAALNAGMIAVDFRREGAYVMARTR